MPDNEGGDIMTLTIEQKIVRRNCIGASEASAVLGLPSFRTPDQVYWDKVDTSDPVEDEPTPAMALGVLLESAIVDYACEVRGFEVERDCDTIVDETNGILCATPDAKVIGINDLVEAKFSTEPGKWGDEGTDEIPDQYLVQCQHQMQVTGAGRVWVPAFIAGGYSLSAKLFCVNRNQAFIDAMVERELKWWVDHVVARIPPTPGPPPVEMLKRLHRKSLSRAILGEGALLVIGQWEEAKVVEKAAKEKAGELKRKALELLGITEPAEEGLLPDGRMITYYSQNSAARCDVAKLRAEHPAIAKGLIKQGSHRVLRVKKGRKL
jgi:putative phage-type endonuclease